MSSRFPARGLKQSLSVFLRVLLLRDQTLPAGPSPLEWTPDGPGSNLAGRPVDGGRSYPQSEIDIDQFHSHSYH